MTNIFKFMTAGFLLLPVLQQTVTPPDAALRKDIYAVYSAMISGPPLPMQNRSDEMYLIQATTVQNQLEPAACVKVPPGDAATLADTLTDYNLRKNIPMILEQEFMLNKPYQLLSSDETEKFMADALRATPQIKLPGTVTPPNTNPLYQKARTVFLLGGVYFNQGRTQAISYVGAYQTKWDFSTFWRAFKKSQNGQWEIDRTWQTCGTGGIR